jgi:thiol-disulfide isomerase/thioredoxin
MKAKISMIMLSRNTLLAALWAITCLFGFNHISKAGSLGVGQSFPSISEIQLEGSLPVELKGKIVFIDFWASWCGPCKKSFPVLEALHRDYKDKGVIIIAVNEDKDERLMTKFLSKNPSTFSIVRDVEHQLISLVGVETMPTSIIIDGNGQVKYVHKGFNGKKTENQYRSQLDALLTEK